MIDTKSKLIVEFLKDHQQFSRLLFEIEKLLATGEIVQAKERAIELNKLAGPHIAYEEAELYPRLATLRETRVTEEHLVDQHQDALDALRLLIESTSISKSKIAQAREGFQRALSHAEHCGSLISLMSQLDATDQAASLVELERFRQEGKLWTELET